MTGSDTVHVTKSLRHEGQRTEFTGTKGKTQMANSQQVSTVLVRWEQPTSDNHVIQEGLPFHQRGRIRCYGHRDS